MKKLYEIKFVNCENWIYGEAIPHVVSFMIEADGEQAARDKANTLVNKIGDDCDWVLVDERAESEVM